MKHVGYVLLGLLVVLCSPLILVGSLFMPIWALGKEFCDPIDYREYEE